MKNIKNLGKFWETLYTNNNLLPFPSILFLFFFLYFLVKIIEIRKKQIFLFPSNQRQVGKNISFSSYFLAIQECKENLKNFDAISFHWISIFYKILYFIYTIFMLTKRAQNFPPFNSFKSLMLLKISKNIFTSNEYDNINQY